VQRYLAIFALFTVAFCGAVAVFNYAVDPYRFYRKDKFDDTSLGNNTQFLSNRLIKPWVVRHKKPTAIIIGTSRSAVIRPRHSTWPEGHSYNLSITGQTVYEMLRFIEHAEANGPLDKLMIGLDFEAFIQPLPRVKPGFEESRLAHDSEDLASPRYIWRGINDMWDTLLSLDTLTRSLGALAGTDKVGVNFYQDGSWEVVAKKYTGQGGYVYQAKERILPLREKKLDLRANFAIFADILRLAHRKKIDTRLLITPEHVFAVDFWARLGCLEMWNEFHHGLVAVNDAVATEMGVQPFPLFGFNHLGGVVDEPIKVTRDAGQSTFSDGSHYRAVLGEQIMESAWAPDGGIGFRLDAASVENYLALVNQLQQQFERDNRVMTARLRHAISPDLD